MPYSIVFLPFLITEAKADAPLPLRGADITQASLRSGAETTLPLDVALGEMTMTLVTVLDELHVAQPYQDDFRVEVDGGVLRVSLRDGADVPAGVWTLILEAQRVEGQQGCMGCPAASMPSKEGAAGGADGSPASDEEGPAGPRGPFALKVDVPSARVLPVEPEVELTLVAPLAYDLLPEGVTEALRSLLCPAGSYPQCVDNRVFLAFREVSDARQSCGWQATLEVERWGQGVSAEYPPRVSSWHRRVSADGEDRTEDVPLEGLCIKPGEVGSFSFVPPDNIPLGRTDLRLITRSVAAAEVPPVSIKLHVRRGMTILVMVTIAGALLKLLHQLVIPALRAAHARRRYLAEALALVQTVKQEPSLNGPSQAGDAGLGGLKELALEYSLKRSPLSQAFWARGEQAELVGKVAAALQGLRPLLAEREQTGTEATPSVPKAPDLTLQPLGPLLLETVLGLVVLVFFVYVTYAPVFVGTLPELAGIFTFAYAANLGLETLMQGIGERFGARAGQGAAKEEPTGRS